MNELGDLVTSLPPWAQAIALAAIAALGLVGVRGVKRSSKGTRQGKRQPPVGLKRPTGETSPGQAGSSATRDLTRSEIAALRPSYAPEADGRADPGEIVWTWVPYAEHDGRGKDRPVLIIARIDAHTTAGCYLSTKQHRGFFSVGSGAWDPQGRESYVAPERVLRIADAGVRREGHMLDRERFESAVRGIVGYQRSQ